MAYSEFEFLRVLHINSINVRYNDDIWSGISVYSHNKQTNKQNINFFQMCKSSSLSGEVSGNSQMVINYRN
jgi:hypothetical protein